MHLWGTVIAFESVLDAYFLLLCLLTRYYSKQGKKKLKHFRIFKGTFLREQQYFWCELVSALKEQEYSNDNSLKRIFFAYPPKNYIDQQKI